jgi:predicted nuclease with RNAse H fold
VVALRCGQGDDDLLATVAGADVTGIDIPLGWPDAFVGAVTAHHRGEPWPSAPLGPLCYRATDLHVEERLRALGVWRRPLSVAADRIAIPAMRAARLLARLAARGIPVDRAGSGRVVEVYPAAALDVWRLPSRGYKGVEGAGARAALLAALEQRLAPTLALDGSTRATCRASDHALDALVAALVARAVARGLCPLPPADRLAQARREGWIAVPDAGSLERLT